jgi:hypothetical protein
MSDLLKFLDGYKTYIGIAFGAGYAVLINLGVVGSDEYVWTAIASWTGIAFRQALNK